MSEFTDLCRHCKTGELYAIRRKGNGELVGSAGPLQDDQVDDLGALPITPDNNAWIEANSQDLILVTTLDVGTDELSRIGSYIKELSESLVGWDTRGFSAEAELPKLHTTIQRLMELSAGSEDEDFRVLLAAMEHEARQCRKAILRRGAMEN